MQLQAARLSPSYGHFPLGTGPLTILHSTSFCGSGISSGVCPLMGLGPGACGILLGRRDWCLPTGGSWLSGGQGFVKMCAKRWLWDQEVFRQPLY